MSEKNKILPPEMLESSRVYLADFDRVTYSQVAWTDEDIDRLITDYQRKVKLLLLVKGHMIIPISHLLESELAREVLGPYPDLFFCGAILPMLPKQYNSANEFLQAQLDSSNQEVVELNSGSEPKEMAGLIDANSRFILWEHQDALQWFQQRILSDLQDPMSLLNLTYKHNNLKSPLQALDQLSDLDSFDRTAVYFAGKALGDTPSWELLSTYADFIYYLSDALVVHSEGILPQENLMDFPLSDLAEGTTRLSDYEVFTKLFVDIVEAITSTSFPGDFLDKLKIPDAIELHSIAVQDKFIEKYNTIQKTIKDSLAIHDPERLVLTLTELESYQLDLRMHFDHELKRELPLRLREEQTVNIAGLLHTLATLVFPAYGNASAAKDILVSGLKILGKDAVIRRINHRVTAAVDVMDRLVDRRDISSRPILLDFVKKMKQRYVEYLHV